MDDLYEVLQVHPRAEPYVIRAAYRALARRHHPDMGGDEHRMMAINAAWAVLGDARLRSAYDTDRAGPSMSIAKPAAADENLHGTDRAHAGAPARSRYDSSEALDFGRYEGWSLQQLVDVDPDYLEWLARTPIGRRFTAAVDELLRARSAFSPITAGSRAGTRTTGR